MKKHIKGLSAVLAVIFILCGISFSVTANTKLLKVGNAVVMAGNVGKISVTAENFDGFTGGFNFEISFPQFVKITNVYLGNNKLAPFSNGGGDYVIKGENTLVLIGTCNYGDDTQLGKYTTYSVEFVVMESAPGGEYPVVITENTCVVSAYDDTALISLSKEDGKLHILGSGFLKADINEDGKADSSDLILLRKNIMGVDCGETFNKISADLYKDGILDIRDLIALKKYFARMIVYLSDNGNDENAGDSADAPVATLDRAIDQVYENGTVYITDTYTIDDAFRWSRHNKPIHITGGTVDATKVDVLNLADDTEFTDTVLNFGSGAKIYANGFSLKTGEDVTVNGNPYLYGGGTSAVSSTSLEIYGGAYREIIGGGHGADVAGDTNVTIGGTVNSGINATDHNGTAYIFGGGNNGKVGGNANLTIGDNAKFVHIFGAGKGARSNVLGKTDVKIYGGSFMSAYAGSTDGVCSETELTLAGGTIEQVFGGSQNTSMTGNARLNIVGGTVTRRIYGGCYNEVTGGGSWQTQNHVVGNTTVFLSTKANVQFGSFNDKGIFACSRYSSHFAEENSTIIYENSDAKAKFSDKLGQKDWMSTWISSWPEAAKTYITEN